MSGDFYGAGEVVRFTNVSDRAAQINFRMVEPGDSILVELAQDVNFAKDDGRGSGGPWGWAATELAGSRIGRG